MSQPSPNTTVRSSHQPTTMKTKGKPKPPKPSGKQK
jgi:hypothetical protein